VVCLKTTDPGFKNDVLAWCKSTGNSLIELTDVNKTIKAVIQKGAITLSQSNVPQKDEKTIVVFSDDFDKIMASFVIANGAAVTGKQVNMFFTFWGLNVLKKANPPKVKKGFLDSMFGMMLPKGPSGLKLSKLNMCGMGTEMMKYVMKSKNVNSLQELIEHAQQAGVKFTACQMSMDVMGIKPEELIDGVNIGGVASYVNSAERSDMNLFI